MSSYVTTTSLPPATAPSPAIPTAVRVERLESADHEVLRAARLAALHDSPDAFVVEPGVVEEELPADTWIERLDESTCVVAYTEGDVREVVGCARSIPDTEDPLARYIEWVWVHPLHRGAGVARAMLDELVRLARTDGAVRVKLWVLTRNIPIGDVYLKCGFAWEMQDHDPEAVEWRMVKELS